VGVVLTAQLASAAMPEHEIKELPGWGKELPSKWYAGYLDGGRNGKYKLNYHYILIESENNPSTDPVLVWSNGGPGAASLFGLLTELGPFYLSSGSKKTKEYNETGIPTLYPFDYSWSKNANLLVLNGPPPVAYSYCDPPGPAGTGTDCGEWTDETTAAANYNFLESFYKAYPEYQKNDLYLSGESYAGVYIPTLAREILKHDNATSMSRRSFKGFLVGNPCMGNEILCSAEADGLKSQPRENYFKAENLWGHGQISSALMEKIRKDCTIDTFKESTKCSAHIAEMNRQATGYFEYHLYDMCVFTDPNLPQGDQPEEEEKLATRSLQSTGVEPDPIGGGMNQYPCGGGGVVSDWVKTPEVRKAFGVASDAFFLSADNGVGMHYKQTETNLIPFYRELAQKHDDIRVLLYLGDTDPTINSRVIEDAVRRMHLKEIRPWRPWTLDNKEYVVGSLTRYEGNFDFLTLRGCGHMAPQNKPQASFEMLSKFLNNQPWGEYNKP